MTYTLNIPDAPNNPSDDQPLMKANTNAISTLIAVDHIGFNLLNSGYHTVIHQKPFDGNSWDPAAFTGGPAAIAGVEQTFSLFSTPDALNPVTNTQLFALSDTSTPYQLTGASTKAEGYAWMGGMAIFWGTVTFPTNQDSAVGSVVFKSRDNKSIPYPNQCRAVLATLSFQPVGNLIGTVAVKNVSITGFDYRFTSDGNGGSPGGTWGTSVFDGFYWMAIGF